MRSITDERSAAQLSCGADTIRESLGAEIEKAIEVIRSIDDLTYCRVSNARSSIGEQFRHNLDFVNMFLAGVEVGRIDYTRRERDARVTISRKFAIERFKDVLTRIVMLDRTTMSGLVSVRSEVTGSTWLASSVVREMEFVLSHTIHHHALIAEKLAGRGISLKADLGVATSTRKYWSRLAA